MTRSDMNQSHMNPSVITQGDFERALGVSRETSAQFETWRARLVAWNARVNLVAASTLDAFWTRHALDGAQLADLANEPDLVWMDIGTGGGAPGLCVALVRAGRGLATDMRLVEANAKKAAFLREVIRETGAPARVIVDRAEALAQDDVHVISARACAPLTRLFGYAESSFNKNTVGLFLKGQDVEAELTAASKSWRFRFDLVQSRSDPNGRIVRIEGLSHVGRATGTYPAS